MAVEGDAEDDLRGGNAVRDMLGDRIVAVLRRQGGIVEGAVVLGRIAHVVGHHIDEIHILDGIPEVHVPGVGGRCHRQEPVASQRLPQVLHQQGEVLGVGGGGRDARHAAGGILPVNVDAVEAVPCHGIEAVLAEVLPVRLVGRHLAEVPGFPSAHGQEHLQGGLRLLERDDLGQPAGRFDVQGLEVALDMGERIVDVRHERGIRHRILPIHRIPHDDGLRRRVDGLERRVGIRRLRGGRRIGLPLFTRRLLGRLDDIFFGRLAAGKQQRKGDKEEGYQSVHDSGSIRSGTKIEKSLFPSDSVAQFG